jgi:hypothetical protein
MVAFAAADVGDRQVRSKLLAKTSWAVVSKGAPWAGNAIDNEDMPMF